MFQDQTEATFRPGTVPVSVPVLSLVVTGMPAVLISGVCPCVCLSVCLSVCTETDMLLGVNMCCGKLQK